jgi:hypothetical protein
VSFYWNIQGHIVGPCRETHESAEEEALDNQKNLNRVAHGGNAADAAEHGELKKKCFSLFRVLPCFQRYCL